MKRFIASTMIIALMAFIGLTTDGFAQVAKTKAPAKTSIQTTEKAPVTAKDAPKTAVKDAKCCPKGAKCDPAMKCEKSKKCDGKMTKKAAKKAVKASAK